MSVAAIKPTSPGRRGMVLVKQDNLYKGSPYKPLLEPKKQSAGRNNHGRITSWHRGGGHKRHYRVVDFFRNKDGVSAKVERLEYDPNRSANLALLIYADGERRYIIAPQGISVGDTLESGDSAPIRPAMPNHCLAFRWALKFIALKWCRGRAHNWPEPLAYRLKL